MSDPSDHVSHASEETMSDDRRYRQAVGVFLSVGSLLFGLLTAAWDVCVIFPGLTNVVSSVLVANEHVAVALYFGNALLGILGVVWGICGFISGDRLCKWLGGSGLIVCLVVQLDYIPRLLSGLKVG